MKTILVLDDEAAVRQSFVDYFEDLLWNPLQAESAEEALEILQTEQPEAAIVDVRLPGMDGNDFIRQASEKHPALKFLICTGSPEYHIPEDIKKIKNVSNCLFKKPVSDLVELEKEVNRMIEF